MPRPSFEQLVQFRKDDVDSWNSGDKEHFAANWHQFLRQLLVCGVAAALWFKARRRGLALR